MQAHRRDENMENIDGGEQTGKPEDCTTVEFGRSSPVELQFLYVPALN